MLPLELRGIATEGVQDFIFSHTKEDEKKLLLGSQAIVGANTIHIAHQIMLRKKAETKLPLHFETKGIVYPPSLNWEQCSSEATANFKVEMIIQEMGIRNPAVADLTGGFGVDSLFLAKKAATLDYIEPDPVLLSLAQHNHHLLGCSSIHYFQCSAEEFLDQCETDFDLIYLDPSRRNLNSKKVIRLDDCRPNAVRLQQQILEHTKYILIKTSPLYDIKHGLNELSAVKKVIVVSVNNECKELLFLLAKNSALEPIVETYNLDKVGNVIQFFSFSINEEKTTVSEFGEPRTYLYEPNASILKAGAFKIVGKKFQLHKLHVNTHFYTSDHLRENFPGRIFKIEEFNFDSRNFVDRKANVISRNYPLKAVELRKKLRLSDGGDKYVIGFSAGRKKNVVLATRLL